MVFLQSICVKFSHLFCNSFRLIEANGPYHTKGPLVQDNEWVHSVMIYSGPNTGIRVHVNGDVKTDNSRGTSSKEALNSSGRVVVGRRYVETDKAYCSTMVDELMLWNRSLTTREVEHLISLY